MSRKDLLDNIIRYVEARYQLNVNDADSELLIKKVVYLARARKDQRLYSYVDQYNAMKRAKVIPVLKKKPIILNKSI